MKTTGIILLVLGCISVLGALAGAAKGYKTSFSGVVLIVIGAFLISRAKKKENEAEKKKEWSENSDKQD